MWEGITGRKFGTRLSEQMKTVDNVEKHHIQGQIENYQKEHHRSPEYRKS